MAFTIGIVGLGLMGASLAQALKGFKGARIVGADVNGAVREAALSAGMVDACHAAASAAADGADLLIFCVYARHIPTLLKECLPVLKPGAVLSDICGVKTPLYKAILPLLPPGVAYTGVHPMAGRERDGIENADLALYANSGLLICPGSASTPYSIALWQDIARHIGCARVELAKVDAHDAMIAYTSDLMHVAACGLCLNYPQNFSLTFTAGAFREATRVADINAPAWTELLMDNRPNILAELGAYIEGLQKIQDAITRRDSGALCALLRRAGDNKREMLRK